MQKKNPILLFLSFLFFLNSHSQCVADYFFINYKGQYHQHINKTIVASQNDLLSIGFVYYSQNGMSFQDGWIIKMTAQGSVVWSKRYNILGHNAVHFRDVIMASDSSYFVSGTVSYIWPIDTTIYSKNIWGILLHIDKQGKLLSSRQLDAPFFSLYNHTFLQSVTKTSDGDFIFCAVVHSPTSTRSSLLAFRSSASGIIKWTTTVSSTINFEFDFGLNKNIQLRDGNILIAGLTDQRTNSGFGIPKVGYYFIKLDYINGTILSNAAWLFINNPANTYFATSESMQHIEELGNGDLSFTAFITDATGLSNPPYTSQSINLIINSYGQLKKVIGYNNGTYSPAALSIDNGEQLILTDDGQNSPLIHIEQNGQVKNVKGFATGTTISPVSLNSAASGYYITLNDRGSYGGSTYLMKVDSTLSINCKQANTQLSANDISSLFAAEDTKFLINVSYVDTVLFSDVPALEFDYPVAATTECIKTCCIDVTEAAANVTICSNRSYTLTDGYNVKDSGTYYVEYKLSSGCDSIAYYHISVIKDPSSLQIKGEYCLEGKDSVVLYATGGFDSYMWNNAVTPDSMYKVSHPGIFSVSVNNSCGFNTISIEVFNKCEFPFYIPNAFTPNGDGLNDVFRIPSSNMYKLIKLTVYNRFGQKIFETTDKAKGWNGTYKNKIQAADGYVYLIMMETLNGKKVKAYGTVMLIR
jgi:gliding motility-associated-like protein